MCVGSSQLEKFTQLSRVLTGVILGGLFACAIVCAEPQPPYQFDSWTTENGLPQNSVNDILQTRDGYLWLATFGGLARFDGGRFGVFDRSVEGIKSQRVKALYEDKKGTLWAGTEDGMLIRYRDGKFTTFTPEEELNNPELFRIEEDEEGNFWMRGSETFIKFDGEHFVNHGRRDFPPDRNARFRKYKVWWRQDSAGLHYFFKGREQIYPLQDLPPLEIIDVTTDHFQNLWIQTKGAGVFKLFNGQLKRFTIPESLPDKNLRGFFLEDTVQTDNTERPNAQTIVLPDETRIRLRLRRHLSANDIVEARRIAFQVTEDVTVDGKILIKKGAIGWGQVTKAQKSKSFNRKAKLDFTIDYVWSANGQKIPVRSCREEMGGTGKGQIAGGIAFNGILGAALTKGKNVGIRTGTSIIAFVNNDQSLKLRDEK